MKDRLLEEKVSEKRPWLLGSLQWIWFFLVAILVLRLCQAKGCPIIHVAGLGKSVRIVNIIEHTYSPVHKTGSSKPHIAFPTFAENSGRWIACGTITILRS